MSSLEKRLEAALGLLNRPEVMEVLGLEEVGGVPAPSLRAQLKSRDQRIRALETELAKREYPTARTSGG